MAQINLIAYRLLKWNAIGDLKAGLYQHKFDAKENGKNIVNLNTIWISDIEYYVKSFKEDGNDNDSVETSIKGNFSVINTDKEDEESIFKRCVLMLVEVLQDFVNKLSEKDNGTAIDVTPPDDFFESKKFL